MIFASDLDRTLIYSRSSMGPFEAEDELIPVEYYDGGAHSFMTRRVVALLRALNDQGLFVPVTTRTTEQYMRVHGISEGLRPRYAIVSNGARILEAGLPDPEWESAVQAAVRSTCAPGDDIERLFEQLAAAGAYRRKDMRDELFRMYIVDRERLGEAIVPELERLAQGSGWTFSLQGRKLYLMPEPVSKGAAVRYVKERTGAGHVFGAGDSLLDASLLDVADEAIAPRHGELYARYGAASKYRFTSRSGIGASEDILEEISNRLEVESAS
ncbi:HAD family hydrolase [Cohnella soli]|uniref:HAD family hydrolase n=1 Tax=Cohnella soli TaxID=425005 RepID=A0ABW0HWC3_9BACL